MWKDVLLLKEFYKGRGRDLLRGSCLPAELCPSREKKCCLLSLPVCFQSLLLTQHKGHGDQLSIAVAVECQLLKHQPLALTQDQPKREREEAVSRVCALSKLLGQEPGKGRQGWAVTVLPHHESGDNVREQPPGAWDISTPLPKTP